MESGRDGSKFKASATLLIIGLMFAGAGAAQLQSEWRIATGEGTAGRITITREVCGTGKGRSNCGSYGRFVSDDGTRLEEDIRLDRDADIGTTQRAVLAPGSNIAQTPGSTQLAWAGLLMGAGGWLIYRYVARMVSRFRPPAKPRWG